MTQQDDTGRVAAARPAAAPGESSLSDPLSGPLSDPQPANELSPDQPLGSAGAGTPVGQPAPPSPYLGAGESVPQAYLAPPQPGQPRYGSPTGYGQRSFGSARQAFGEAGYGRQPGYGQQPGRADPRLRSARGGFSPRRDPALAAPWERLIASMLDWIVIFGLSVLAFLSPLLRILHSYQAIALQNTDLNSPQAQAALNAIARNPANERALLFWFLAMFGIALVYYWAQQALWGATLGKRALGLRVVTAVDSSRIGVRAAGIRSVAFLVGPAACMLLPAPLNIPGGILWLADTGLSLLDSRAQCLHDKLAGTIVIRQRRLDQQARSSGRSPW
jgi:uncharacterized RDD family membrane protein YckC